MIFKILRSVLATLLIAKIQLYEVPTTIHQSIRNHPPDKDIPSYEIVNPQARYCAIKKRCLYATSCQSPYLNYYDIDTGKILGTMGGDFIKENQVSFFLDVNKPIISVTHIINNPHCGHINSYTE